MPGTIQVSVLEFKGISSSSGPSAISVEVSIGKRCYRTRDKGDFSFPVAKLSEELVVTLVDDEENEIAYTGIRIMQIIQKGTWDDIFLLEGGGQVHMKLQFVLNEEEKNRIRVMRESAMKKNLATTSKINLNRSESASLTVTSEEKSTHSEQNVSEVVSREVEASPADSPSSSEASSVGSTSSYQKEEEIIQEIKSPIVVEMLSSSTFSHKTETHPSQEDKTSPAEKFEMESPVVKSKDPDPMEKAPSSVRKMISAFESGQLKDVKSLKRPSSILPEQKVVRKEHPLEGQDEKGVPQSTNQNFRKSEVAHLSENLSQNLNVSGQEDNVSSVSQPFPDLKESKSSIAPLESSEITSVEPTVEKSNKPPVNLASSDIPSVGGLRDLDSSHAEPSLAPKYFESTVAPVELSGKESDRSPVYLTRQPVSETATSSGREHEVQSQEIEAYDSSAVEVEESETETGVEGSKFMDIRGTSDQKSESLDFDKEEFNFPENSGLWIFPQLGHLCITTAGNQVMKMIELQHTETNTHQEKEVSLESEILQQQCDIQETGIGNMPEFGSFPDDSSNRLIGQAIRIAVILGFGALVLLTPKKEPRKKKSEEIDFLFSIPSHIDERTLTE